MQFSYIQRILRVSELTRMTGDAAVPQSHNHNHIIYFRRSLQD